MKSKRSTVLAMTATLVLCAAAATAAHAAPPIRDADPEVWWATAAGALVLALAIRLQR
jgi:MYXO-CTERM domain-containing protein